MSQEEWMWMKIYNHSLHEPFAPTKLVWKQTNKQQITYPIYQILLIPTLRRDNAKKKTKKKKARREDGVLFNVLVCYCKLTA